MMNAEQSSCPIIPGVCIGQNSIGIRPKEDWPRTPGGALAMFTPLAVDRLLNETVEAKEPRISTLK